MCCPSAQDNHLADTSNASSASYGNLRRLSIPGGASLGTHNHAAEASRRVEAMPASVRLRDLGVAEAALRAMFAYVRDPRLVGAAAALLAHFATPWRAVRAAAAEHGAGEYIAAEAALVATLDSHSHGGAAAAAPPPADGSTADLAAAGAAGDAGDGGGSGDDHGHLGLRAQALRARLHALQAFNGLVAAVSNASAVSAATAVVLELPTNARCIAGALRLARLLIEAKRGTTVDDALKVCCALCLRHSDQPTSLSCPGLGETADHTSPRLLTEKKQPPISS